MKNVTPQQLEAAKKEWMAANPGKTPTADDISGQAYTTLYNQAFADSGFGTGGKVQQAIQAATAAVQGLAGGGLTKAIAGGSAPYIANIIGSSGMDDAGKVLAHAAVNAALAAAQGNNALVGAGGAATAEMIGMIATGAYGKPVSELSEEQKQTVSALATLAAGLAGGLIGDSSADTVAGAQAGKTTVENNALGCAGSSNPYCVGKNDLLITGGGGSNTSGRGGSSGLVGKNSATNSLQGVKLNDYYRQAEKYGQGGVKELEDGRFRFYGTLTPAKTSGEMTGARLVREWDPKSGQTRTWYETLDHAGNIRSVAPKPVTNDKNHHIFDANGNYQGRR